MTVSSIPPTSSSTTPPPAAKSSVGDLDYNAFLKLLIAQLKNQDPSQPMDSTAFVAQLATFSQVEQSVSSNSKLDSLLSASGITVADSVIGRTITAPDGSASGVVTSVRITTSGPIATLANGDTVALTSGVVIS